LGKRAVGYSKQPRITLPIGCEIENKGDQENPPWITIYYRLGEISIENKGDQENPPWITIDDRLGEISI
jgi:hypothetical protein